MYKSVLCSSAVRFTSGVSIWVEKTWSDSQINIEKVTKCPVIPVQWPIKDKGKIRSIWFSCNITIYPITVTTYFLLYARQRRVILCRAVCPSVNLSCPLHNSDTVQDIVMKLGTNINHHQTMCRKQEPTLYLHFLRNYGRLKFFL